MQYEVSASCQNLKDADFFSKSDPQLVLLRQVPNTKRFAELGRTEFIKDCLDPEFAQKFRVEPHEEGQVAADPNMRVAVVDVDNFAQVDDLSKQEFLGSSDFPLSTLLEQPSLTVALSKGGGQVTLKAVKYDPSLDGRVQLLFSNGNFDLEGKSAFLEIYRADQPISDEQQQYTLAYRSEQVECGKFQPISASLFTLSMGDLQRSLQIRCLRRRSRGNHQLLGTCCTCLADMQHALATEGTPVITFTDAKDNISFLRIDLISVQS